MNYFFIAGDEVKGPFSMFEMEDFALKGVIIFNTRVSTSDDPNRWLSWGELRPDYVQSGPARPRTLEASPASLSETEDMFGRPRTTLEKARNDLRCESAYPNLRACLVVLIVITGIALVASAITLIVSLMPDGPDMRMIGFAGIAASVGSIFSILILGILLDIADCSLRKTTN